uniref:Uncharacterized protein n=1 Tax=Ditylenchus dipsaci TaxID=166011 RepID=A0A915DTT7_9BILA
MGSSYSALGTSDDNDVMRIIASTENMPCRKAPTISTPNKTRPIIRPAVHLEAINWLAAVRSGMVLSCSSDNTIVLNNIDTGACVFRWRGHQREITKTIYKHVAANTFDPCGQFTHQMAVTGLAALDDSKFVSGSRDGQINIWDMESDFPIRSVYTKHNLVTHVDYDSSSQMIAQTSEDGHLRLWDTRQANLQLIHQFPSKGYAQWHTSICPTSNYCLTANGGSSNEGGEISLWDLRQRKLLRDYHGHEGNVRCALLFDTEHVTWKRLILSVSNDQTVRLWNLNTGMCMWTEALNAELNCCVAFADGSIVIGGGDATLCEMKLLGKAGRPFLSCNSIQSNCE